MVKKDARGQDMNKKEKLQGSVAEIFSTKVNGKLPARILISAPAGRGKTTAVAKMAYDWVHRERGSALEHLPLLFVVKFRNTSQLTSIGEAIKSHLLSDVHDLTPEGLESFIRENQEICHIILDGLDEYAGISSSNRSLESNMVSVIRWEEFPECRVLVTTRPHLENFFNQDDLSRVYTKMWIEGFSQESSREYTDKFFASTSSPDRGRGLKVYLDDQPLINELVKTPLFCLMVCHLWSEELLNTKTTTQTELLDSVNDFLMHHANARATSKGKQITDENLGEIIRKLGKVALAGLLDDSKKLVFTPHDFRRVPYILDRACELGILSKMTVTPTRLPRSHKTTSITIEFYHKLAQEHSAGKYLAAKAKSRKRQWPWQISKLDSVLLKINANIGDYEHLLRFAAGTDNSLCIRIMEALLSNSNLDESERYRILLDCSSETKGTEGNVSSLVQRCVNAESIVLKSPTVYTVVGMQNLPKQLKRQVMTIKFEGSTLTTDVTSGLWSCLESFSMLRTLTISDSSLSFHPSTHELPSVEKLSAKRLTSQSYEGLLSSLPGLVHIDITIDDAEKDIPQITTGLRRAGGQQLTHIELTAPLSLPSEKNSVSRETMRGLGLLIREQTKKLQQLKLYWVKCTDEEDLVYLIECCRRVKTMSYVR
ncbi:protein NLRC5-like [Strongylocentrotus purpuratus]|uniref:NACHT domain-containing protein n=1 Tax=Strongylocentrotus purpuratus TaxID=7668 RepID=A0A7M7PID4_STRPU|nr:protein NLRC5-like [Strongylocentrotus purpuratus]